MPFFWYLHSLLTLIPLSLQLNEFNPMGDTLASVMGECTLGQSSPPYSPRFSAGSPQLSAAPSTPRI